MKYLKIYIHYREIIFSWFLQKIEKENSGIISKNIKLFLNEDKYFYWRLLIFIIILYLFYKNYLFLRYLISLLIFIIILRYNILYNFIKKNNNIQETLKYIFLNYSFLNKIGYIIYNITNLYNILYYIQKIIIITMKILNYLSIKLKFKYYFISFKKFIYFIFFIYLDLVFFFISKFY